MLKQDRQRNKHLNELWWSSKLIDVLCWRHWMSVMLEQLVYLVNIGLWSDKYINSFLWRPLKLVKSIPSFPKAIPNTQLYQPLHTNTKHRSLNVYSTLTFHRHKTRSSNSSTAKHKSKVIITDMKKIKPITECVSNTHVFNWNYC
jgi:hypothetical protein